MRTSEICKSLALLALFLLLGGGIILLAGEEVHHYWTHTRGIEPGLDAQAPLMVPRFGLNVALERYPSEQELDKALETVKELGVRVVRQRFRWAEIEPTPGTFQWQYWDHVLALVQKKGLHVIAVLDGPPAWARPAEEAGNPWAPPSSPESYARFCRAFAARYRTVILAYQIWDEPNIYPHWGQGEIDPAGYVRLLQAGSEAIRQADPSALIIAGGLAPNLETGGRNLSDLAFLREIYRRGAGKYFDVLGVKAYGFWSGPDDRRVAPEVLNFSRVILLREEMRRRGEASKPIWALEGGWCALPKGWQGSPSPQGSDLPFIQAERLKRAMMRIQREWPWMTLACLNWLQPAAPPEDPIWGYALLDAQGSPTLAAQVLRNQMEDNVTFYPGLTREVQPLLRQRFIEAKPNRNHPLFFKGGLAKFTFWGTDLALDILQGQSEGELTLTVDALHREISLPLAGPNPRIVRHLIGRHMPPALHEARLRGSLEQLGAIQSVRVGYCPPSKQLVSKLLVVAVALFLLGIRAWALAKRIPWASLWQRLLEHWQGLPLALRAILLLGAFAAPWAIPMPLLRWAPLGLYGLLALLEPSWALGIAVFCIPFAPIHLPLGIGTFSVAELSLLIALASQLWNRLLVPQKEGRGRPKLLDGVVLCFALVGLLCALLAEYRHVALREWRTTILEPSILYALIRTQRRPRRLLWLVDILFAASVAVALYGLALYPFPSGVIEAEGVRRAHAFYGSPNNLALWLERVLPLGLAMVLWGDGRRRRLYALGTLPLGVLLVLTFSRGALLVGLPVSLFVLGWLRGGKARWLALGALCFVILVMIPFIHTERFASLWNPSQGTVALRIKLWQASWEMLRDHPWLGVGPDNFLYYYGDYIRPGAEVDRWLSHPHNIVLDFWLRLGIGGLVLLLLSLAAFGWQVQRLRRRMRPPYRAALLGLAGGMAACLAHGLIDSAYFVPELALWWMFTLAWVQTQSS